MIDGRISNNPSKQNEQHYTLISFRGGFDGRHCDYYLPCGAYRPEGFVISKEPFDYPNFTGITIHTEKAKQIILSIDWNEYASKNIASYTITYADFHRGYNNA